MPLLYLIILCLGTLLCSKTIKNTPVIPNVALGDMFVHNDEHMLRRF